MLNVATIRGRRKCGLVLFNSLHTSHVNKRCSVVKVAKEILRNICCSNSLIRLHFVCAQKHYKFHLASSCAYHSLPLFVLLVNSESSNKFETCPKIHKALHCVQLYMNKCIHNAFALMHASTASIVCGA